MTPSWPCFIGVNVTRKVRSGLQELAEAQGISVSMLIYQLALQTLGLPDVRDKKDDFTELPESRGAIPRPANRATRACGIVGPDDEDD